MLFRGLLNPMNRGLIHPITTDYRAEDFVQRIRSLTGEGVDAAFDPVGGARHVWRTYRAVRKGGTLVWFGMAATKTKGLRVIPFTMLMQGLLTLMPGGKQVPLMPDLATFSQGHHDWYRKTLTELLDSLAEGRIKPVVAECIPLAEAARAHEQLERGGHAGKMVLVTSP
jgi:NADPH:quinone reductase-like Zn-dependent oxidoreductase